MPDQTWEEQHPDCEPINPNSRPGVYSGDSYRLIINKAKYKLIIENETEHQFDIVVARRKP